MGFLTSFLTVNSWKEKTEPKSIWPANQSFVAKVITHFIDIEVGTKYYLVKGFLPPMEGKAEPKVLTNTKQYHVYPMEWQLYTNLKIYWFNFSEHNKNATFTERISSSFPWKNNQNLEYLRTLNNIIVSLWNGEIILNMLFAMNDETILSVTYVRFISRRANL